MTILGCILIAIGTIVAAFSSSEEWRKCGWHRVKFLVLIVVGASLIAGGTWLTIYDGQRESAGLRRQLKENREAGAGEAASLRDELKRNSRAYAEAKVESDKKFDELSAQLNAAQRQNSKRTTDEQMALLQYKIEEWGKDSAKNYPVMKSSVDKMKRERNEARIEAEKEAKRNENERQVKLTERAFPSVSLAKEYLQGLVRANATNMGLSVTNTVTVREALKEAQAAESVAASREQAARVNAKGVPDAAYHEATGTALQKRQKRAEVESQLSTLLSSAVKAIVFDMSELPRNFFGSSYEGVIKFPGKAVWRLNVGVDDNTSPYLKIDFTDSDGQMSGSLKLSANTDSDNIQDRYFTVDYRAELPVFDAGKINGDYPLSEYETRIQQALDKVIGAQLLQVEERKGSGK